jgi:hypothetical protein
VPLTAQPVTVVQLVLPGVSEQVFQLDSIVLVVSYSLAVTIPLVVSLVFISTVIGVDEAHAEKSVGIGIETTIS